MTKSLELIDQLFINIVDNQVDHHLNRVQTKGQRQSHWSSDKVQIKAMLMKKMMINQLCSDH